MPKSTLLQIHSLIHRVHCLSCLELVRVGLIAFSLPKSPTASGLGPVLCSFFQLFLDLIAASFSPMKRQKALIFYSILSLPYEQNEGRSTAYRRTTSNTLASFFHFIPLFTVYYILWDSAASSAYKRQSAIDIIGWS